MADADLLPISDIPGEMVCLHALVLAKPDLYAEVRSSLSVESFLQADHQILFRLITEIRDPGGAMDGRILAAELDRRGMLDDIGGYPYLAQVMNAAPDPANARQYVKHVVETHRLRQIENLANQARRAVRLPTNGTRSSKVIEELQSQLAKLAGSTATNSIQTLGEALADALQAFDPKTQPRYLPTGVNALDCAVGGLGIGEMTLIAARPSMGKSLFGKQIANNLAERGVPVFFGNVEENNQKTARNWLSMRAKIDNQRLRQRSLSKAERDSLPGWAEVGKELPYWLCDRAMTVGDMCSTIALAHSRHGIKAAFVDYLQLLDTGTGDNRQEQVAAISRQLKNLFKRLDIAGVVMAQLNRGNEAGQVRPPRLSDLRESGQIEQDADAVLFIHRPDFYARENGQQPNNEVQIIIAKYRDGSRDGDVKLVANLAHQEFLEPPPIEDPFI